MSTPLSDTAVSKLDLDAVNMALTHAPPLSILEWAQREFGESILLTSSFGAESALMLHLVTRVMPRVRVVFLDTGYLFPETYRFAEELTQRFDLDVRAYSPLVSAARQEALHGKLWEGDEQDLELYNRINKVEPMDRALRELKPRAWLAGLRWQQTKHRAGLRPVELAEGVYKVHPIIAWSHEDVHAYMRANDLPYHPLRARGYRSIGDVHSTFPTNEGEDARQGRRLGEKSECGIHLPRAVQPTEQSRQSSGL